ncbi:hypothetical protein BC834DRAFT_974816 [Gloeopeniophorella convolvens]|nr:hypothetical protein BC834DRAFT_974816 [Gloeopeniophorella convolvens]
MLTKALTKLEWGTLSMFVPGTVLLPAWLAWGEVEDVLESAERLALLLHALRRLDVPLLCVLLGMFVERLIDKGRVHGDAGSGGARARCGPHYPWSRLRSWRAGPAGSIALLVLKHTIRRYQRQYQCYAYVNIAVRVSLVPSAVVLWIAQCISGNYEYGLSSFYA